MRSLRFTFFSAALMFGLAATAPAITAKSKTAGPKAKDEIVVVAHIPLSSGPVTRFFTTQHLSSSYLYAAHASGGGAALIDITKAGSPALLADAAGISVPGSLAVVAGTSALVASAPEVPAASVPETIRVIDMSDPHQPKVAREFTGVTAMNRDDRRGLIFLANPEGVWILQQHLAVDPQVEKDYANYVLYSH